LVSKRRTVKLSSTTGVRSNPITDALQRLSPETLIVIFAAVALALICILIISSCRCSGGCSSCATGCAGCAAGCSQCGSPSKENHPTSVNSLPPGREYYGDGVLYYTFGDNIISLNDTGESAVVAAGANISCLSADGEGVYYISGGAVYFAPFEKPIVISDDPDEKYASRRILSPSVSGGDTGPDANPDGNPNGDPDADPDAEAPATAITGYARDGDDFFFWQTNPVNGQTEILRAGKDEAADTTLYTGSIRDITYYQKHIYFYDMTADPWELCRIPAGGGEPSRLSVAYNNAGYALGGGLYFYSPDQDGVMFLCKADPRNMKSLGKWQITGLHGIIANDSYVYYWKNTEDSGALFCMDHSGTDAKELIRQVLPISPQSVCGDYISLYVNTTVTGDPTETTEYRIVNTATGLTIA